MEITQTGSHRTRWFLIAISAFLLTFFLLTLIGPSLLCAQGPTPPKPQPDVLIFTNGEKLIGHLVRSTGSSVTFASDMAGEITVDWSKIQELHSAQNFAVIGKNVKLGKHPDTSKILQGTVSMTDKQLKVAPAPDAPGQTIPVADAAYVVDQATFQKDLVRNPNFFQDWKGGITGGASLVQATQDSRTFTGAVNLVRAIPVESWLTPANRTTFDFLGSYGKVTQPGTAPVKTEIYHFDAERDEYFSPRVFAFGSAAFDHNFSQGLALQQSYGGGIGVTVIKNDKEELDLKGSVNYIHQQFDCYNQSPDVCTTPDPDSQSLIGSTFAENYMRKLPRSIVLTESLSITPSWNVLEAYSAIGNVAVSMPLYKRFNLTLSVLDNYLNNPPVGFQKNSFQFTAGLTYTLP